MMTLNSENPKEVEAAVAIFEKKLDRLKILYEQYFMGIEKREPLVPLKDVVRIMRELDKIQIRNTAIRYRYRNLIQKFNSYKTYWSRTLRQIENGTYFRDVARVRRKYARQGIELEGNDRCMNLGELERALAKAKDSSASSQESMDDFPSSQESMDDFPSPQESMDSAALPQDSLDTDSPQQNPLYKATSPHGSSEDTRPQRDPRSAPVADPRKQHRAGPPPVPTPSNYPLGLTEDHLQSVFRRYQKAKALCGGDPDKVRFESLKDKILKQAPLLEAKYPGREVEFKIVIRDGKPVLKAVPRV